MQKLNQLDNVLQPIPITVDTEKISNNIEQLLKELKIGWFQINNWMHEFKALTINLMHPKELKDNLRYINIDHSIHPFLYSTLLKELQGSYISEIYRNISIQQGPNVTISKLRVTWFPPIFSERLHQYTYNQLIIPIEMKDPMSYVFQRDTEFPSQVDVCSNGQVWRLHGSEYKVGRHNLSNFASVFLYADIFYHEKLE